MPHGQQKATKIRNSFCAPCPFTTWAITTFHNVLSPVAHRIFSYFAISPKHLYALHLCKLVSQVKRWCFSPVLPSIRHVSVKFSKSCFFVICSRMFNCFFQIFNNNCPFSFHFYQLLSLLTCFISCYSKRYFAKLIFLQLYIGTHLRISASLLPVFC